MSGTIARLAVERGHDVWAVSRGERPLPDGVIPVTVDREDRAGFAAKISACESNWDLVVDCIGYEPEDAQQDIAVFRERAGHLVFISTDFVFEPGRRRFPQSEESEHYLSDDYGGKKRVCERAFIEGDTGDMAWTVVRPCHIYGPGSKLGCLPNHGRDDNLIEYIRSGSPLELVGGGYFLQQPILSRDLADLILAMRGNARSHGEIFQAAGPDIIESRAYYFLIADLLGVDRPVVNEIPVGAFLAENPHRAPFCCHRIYNLDKLRSAGLPVPATPIRVGLAAHVRSMITRL